MLNCFYFAIKIQHLREGAGLRKTALDPQRSEPKCMFYYLPEDFTKLHTSPHHVSIG